MSCEGVIQIIIRISIHESPLAGSMSPKLSNIYTKEVLTCDQQIKVRYPVAREVVSIIGCYPSDVIVQFGNNQCTVYQEHYSPTLKDLKIFAGLLSHIFQMLWVSSSHRTYILFLQFPGWCDVEPASTSAGADDVILYWNQWKGWKEFVTQPHNETSSGILQQATINKHSYVTECSGTVARGNRIAVS